MVVLFVMVDHRVGCGVDVRSAWVGIAECCFHRDVCHIPAVMLSCLEIGVLVLRCSITGTLDPVRNLTGLTDLRCFSNNISGICIFEAVGMVRLCWSVDASGGGLSRGSITSHVVLGNGHFGIFSILGQRHHGRIVFRRIVLLRLVVRARLPCRGFCVLVCCWANAGTLDPLRNLTGLTYLSLSTNSVSGMSIVVAVGMVLVVLECGCQCGGWGMTATHTWDIAFDNCIACWCCVDRQRGAGNTFVLTFVVVSMAGICHS